MNRVRNTKLVLWLITGFAAAVGLNRFIFGLGATTNLTDATPWGLWIGFDVMGGVALAAGGFVMTAIFYIMKREEFHPLVKPAVLTAFLGYLAVVFGLLFDLGLPWNIWHMIVYWNPHSPLFEVGWCVMLYSAVLLLEFSPVPLEEFSRYAKIRNFLMRFRFVFVLLGIMLSTLHQSSLGSLFLIMPFKLHPLWYSNILPIEFFISAIALGLMMVALESQVSHWLYKRKPETNLVAKLGKTVVWVLGTYFLVKFIDLTVSGKLGLIINGSWESFVFITEIMISIIIPVIIFAVPKLRNNTKAQWIGSFMVVFGMVLNRINVGGLTMLSVTGDSYTPSWMEITISLGVVSAAALVFLFAIEKFHVWDLKPQDPESLPHSAPSFDYSSHAWLGTPDVSSLTKYSLAFVISFAVGMALMPESKL
ncbi:Ni/Fe-hydrogenase cytochrome b subunit, partial [bacterium BMS3Abin03]|nr:Ni/Fe-hydrogenase cytochrome b subunit [bacterium BMS3Abin03]